MSDFLNELANKLNAFTVRGEITKICSFLKGANATNAPFSRGKKFDDHKFAVRYVRLCFPQKVSMSWNQLIVALTKEIEAFICVFVCLAVI